jgi:acyl carrier protein
MEAKLDGAIWTDATVADRVREIVASHSLRSFDEVALSDRISDLGLDSLGVVEVIFAIEESFEISVPFNANDPNQGALDLSTVGALVKAVEGVIAAQ